ncbi:GTP-binding protein Rhes-like [Glossina fuscipes]|uniref:GTP-binding protein Rhes-like n=1 Tax=Glossina fuscipes TaxID=7396 RepID=A0A9C6DZZ0_9MUSC|nr:GTP-binding protein Rhes-like [Glossina fuscipes]
MGAARVGKSCIISQFLYDKFNVRYKKTVEELHRGEDWQAYGVIIKLLEIWRYSSKIDAINFCLTPKYRNHKALAFHSLLFLAAEQFIEITKRINSLEMDEIKLGRLSEKLINAHYHIK